MTELSIGEVIRRRRAELEISQERLCAGVCEPCALSRFENGKQTLSNRQMRTLLQRVGLSDDRFHALLSERELALEKADREARNASVALIRAAPEDRPKAWRHFQMALEYLEAQGADDPFVRQCSLSLRATVGTEEGPYSFGERLAMQLEAIRITVPWFDVEHVGLGPYSTEELRLISQIGETYSNKNQYEKAVCIHRAVIEYLEANCYRLPQYSTLRAWSTYSCSRTLSKMGRLREALDLLENGRHICVASGRYVTLAYFLWLQAECNFKLGHLQPCAKLLYQAHYMLKATGDAYQLPILDADAKKWCNITFSY